MKIVERIRWERY